MTLYIAFYLMNLSCISVEFLGGVTYFFIVYVMLVYKKCANHQPCLCRSI